MPASHMRFAIVLVALTFAGASKTPSSVQAQDTGTTHALRPSLHRR